MSVVELEQAVSSLPPRDFVEFSKWFEEFAADQWDKQIESDVAAGKLDHLASKADDAYNAGHCTAL
jgi:hypothetical protein